MKIHIPKFLKRKRNLWIIGILIVAVAVGFLIFGRGKSNVSIQTSQVTKQDIQQTVLSTGQVISGIDLSLGFQSSGVVKKIYVKEGDTVKQGQTLAILDQSSVYASLLQAQGSLAQAQANYDKLVAGATFDDTNTVIKSRQIALDGAYNDALNVLNDARLKSYNALSAVNLLQNTYFTDFSGDARDAKVKIQNALSQLDASLDKAKSSGLKSDIDNSISTAISSLNTISNSLKIVRDTLDSTFYYGIIPDSERTIIDTQRANINTALTSVTSSQQAISAAKISVLQSQPEIDLAQAQILSARGQVAAAQALVNNTVLSAPSEGTITNVDVKVGEQAPALKEVVILQNINDLHAEANVSEANIAALQIGQPIDYTFDALGPDQHFAGKVLSIDPASTVISGVVNYIVKGSFENVPNIKPGMTANMTILIAEKSNVLAVPSTAVINKNSKYYVRVIDNLEKKTFHEVEVKIGLQADGGLIEIISGLNEGQQIISYMK